MGVIHLTKAGSTLYIVLDVEVGFSGRVPDLTQVWSGGQMSPLKEDRPENYVSVLRELSDDRWREFDHKTRIEWRLSFAVWITLLAATGGVLKGQFPAIANTICIPISCGIAVIVVVFHFMFLRWVQRRLQDIREDMWEIYKERWNVVLAPPKLGPLLRERRRRSTTLVQLGITSLLGLLLVAMTWQCCVSKSAEVLRSTSTTVEQKSDGRASAGHDSVGEHR